MARLGGRVGLGTITRALFVCGLGTVGRTRATEGMATISGAGWEGGSGKWPGCVGGQF
jgi:hypothetical protein